MWLVKQAASKVKSISQQILREKTKAEKLVEDIVSNRHEVMPVRKMAELASLSFEGDSFQQIVEFMGNKLADIKFERKSLKKRLNLIVLAVYLVKHGAGGFIDQFRAMKTQLKRYEDLRNFVAEEDPEMRSTIQQLRDRSAYLLALLYDKAALLREKEVARLIREKLFLQGGDYSRQQQSNQSEQKNNKDRVQQFLQHYVWRYTQKLDKKLDQITDILIAKIDEYLDGDMPEDFEIEQAELNTEKNIFTKSEFQLGGEAARKEEARYINEKLQIKDKVEIKQKKEQNLLQLEETSKQTHPDLMLLEQVKPNGKQVEKKDKTQQNVLPPYSIQNNVNVMNDEQIQIFRSQLSSPGVATSPSFSI